MFLLSAANADAMLVSGTRKTHRAELLRATALAGGVIAAMLVLVPVAAEAQVNQRQWSGAISGDPSVGGNWFGGQAPQKGDNGRSIGISTYAILPPTFGSGQYNWSDITIGLPNRPVAVEDTVTFASGAVFGSNGMPPVAISVYVNSGQLNIASGASILSANSIINFGWGSLTVSAPSSVAAQPRDTGGTVYNSGTVEVVVTNRGSFTNNAGGLVGVSANDTSVFNYAGSVGAYNVPNATIGWQNAVAGFSNYGTITSKSQFSGSTTVQRYAVQNSGYFVNGVTGTPTGSLLGVINNGVLNTNGFFANQGIVNGSSALSGGTFSNGTLYTALDLSGNVSGEGRVSGTLENITVSGGTFLNYGNVTGVVELGGGTTTNLATVNKAKVSGGTFNNDVRVINNFPPATAETLRGVISTSLDQTGGQVNNSGDLNGLTSIYGGLLDNKTGGTIANLNVSSTTGNAGTVTNSGTITVATTSGPGSLTNKSGGTIGPVTNGGTFINELGGVVNGNVSNNNSSLNVVQSANFGTLKGELTVNGGTFTQAGKLEGIATVGTNGTLVFGGIFNNVATSGDLASNLRSTGTNFSNDGKVIFRPYEDMVVNGSIFGSGKVEVDGTSGGKVTINRAYVFGNFTQDVDIKSGRLVMNALLNSNVQTFQTLNVAAGSSLTLNDDDDRIMERYKVTGAGNFIKGGSGVLTVGSGLQNTGIVGVAGGRLQFGAGAGANNGINQASVLEVSNGGEIALGTTAMRVGGLRGLGTGSITGTGNIEINSAANTTNQLTIALGGNGRSITKTGAGTQEFYGANTYSGGTTIKAGILKVGSSGALGTGGVAVEAGGNLELGTLGNFAGADFTFDKIITGAGGLIKTSSNTVTLSAENTYTGDTQVKEGTLRLSGTGKIALASKIVVSSGAKFDIGAAQFSTNTLTNVGGDLVGGGGTLVLNFTTPETFTGKISDGIGAGNTFKLQVDGGKLTLNGDNSFTGGIVIRGHNTEVVLGHNNAAGGANNTILTRGTIITYLNNVNSNTPIIIGSNTTQLQVNGADSATQSGVISEDQAGRPLEKIGTGTLFFSAGAGMPLLNTYSGATTITAGTLQIDNTRNLGNDSATNTLILNGGTLNNTSAVTMARGVTVNATGGTVNAGNDLTLNGGVSIAQGGTLTKTGTGTLTVSGTGTGTGMLVLNGGSLSLGSSTALGGASLRVDQAANLSSTGNVTFGNAIVLNANLTAPNTGANTLTLSGPISGNSGITKTSTGTLNLTGNNSFTGSVSLASGTLGVGSNTALGTGNMSMATRTTMQSLANVTLTNNIVLTQSAGFGTNNAVFDTNGFNMTLSGVISTNVPANEPVQPGLTKNGAGNLTLSGVNTYRGATIINAGKLIVNGSIANTSSVTIANGAVLGGNAAIPNLMVQSGASLSPGNSIGTVNIAGNLTLNAGSTTVIEIQQAQVDKINAGGTAALAGTLQLVALGGPYNFGTPYNFLTATGGINGTFATVTTDAAFGVGVTSAVSYNANNAFVTLTAAPIAQVATTIALTRPKNVFAVASAMDRAVANGADASAFFNIYNQPTREALAAAVNTLSGEVHTTANAMAVKASDQFMRVMLDPFAIGRDGALMNAGAAASSSFNSWQALAEPGRVGGGLEPFMALAPAPAQRFAVWGAAYGQSARGDADAVTVGSSRLAASDGHIAVGADLGVMPGLIAGVAISGGQGSATLGNGLGSAKADIYQAGVYTMGRFGALSFGVSASYGSIQTETTRAVPALNLTALKADYRAESWSGRAEAAYAVARLAGFGISPTAAIQVQSVKTPSFVEINGNTGLAAGVTSTGKTNNTVRSELGVKLDYVAMLGGSQINLYASAAWGHYYARDAKFAGSLIGLAGSAFTVEGVRPPRDSALIAVGADMKLGANMYLGGRFDTEQSSTTRSYSGSAKLRMAF